MEDQSDRCIFRLEVIGNAAVGLKMAVAGRRKLERLLGSCSVMLSYGDGRLRLYT